MGKETTSSAQTSVQNIQSVIRSYSRELFALDTKPLIDARFSFPWEEFGTVLSKTFGVPISCSPQEIRWRDSNDLYEGLVTPFLPIDIAIPGVSGQFFLMVSRSDIELIMKESLQVSIEQLLEENATFFDQFLLFFKVELCAAAHSIDSLKTLSPRLTATREKNDAGYLCLDISLNIAGQNALTRLFLPSEFLKGWQTKHTSFNKDKVVVKNAPLHISIEAGRTFIGLNELSSFQVGDVLLLKYPFLIPESEKSRVFLTYGGKPLFRGKVTDGGVKILEMPLQHEAFIPLGEFSMANKEPIPEEIEEPLEESSPESTPQEIDLHPESIEEEDPFKEEEEEPSKEKALKEASKTSTMITDKPVRLQDIPLPVVVQLKELTMTMGELASLQPGNLLNLDIVPDHGVSLVINGRIIAQGELIMIGDHVGVRLQEIDIQQ